MSSSVGVVGLEASVVVVAVEGLETSPSGLLLEGSAWGSSSGALT